MSAFGHKELASFLLHRNTDKKYDPYEGLSESNLSHHETSTIFNKRLINLNNIPPHLGSRGNRVHSGAFIRACHGMQQNTAKSLDLLRQIIQNSINAEIGKVISKYLDLYFMPAKRNIAMNNEAHEVSPEHIQNICCQILEEHPSALSRFSNPCRCPDKIKDIRSSLAAPSLLSSIYSLASHCLAFRILQTSLKCENDCENVVPKRRKRTFSSGSDSKLPFLSKKIRHSPFPHRAGSGRSTPNKGRFVEPIKKEGPRWDSKRMTTETMFIMGSKANKALGLGATRGRLYIKHPDIFKYAGDQDDKQWLYEKMHMPATGGRTYLLMVEDILYLSQMDEYRNSPGLMLNEIVGFTVPIWMIEKMKYQMESQRTDKHLRNLSKELMLHEVTVAPKAKHASDSDRSSDMPFMEETNEDELDNDDPHDQDYTCAND